MQHLGFEREFWELAETARKHGKTNDPLVRQQLALAYTGVQVMRFSGLRTLAQVAEGRPPGPEASVAKLMWSEYHKKLGELAIPRNVSSRWKSSLMEALPWSCRMISPSAAPASNRPICFRFQVEAPGTAPGSEWLIPIVIYRHSRREAATLI